jgi:hypothetical protein
MKLQQYIDVQQFTQQNVSHFQIVHWNIYVEYKLSLLLF